MTEWGELQICIKFCVKLEHFCMETIQMIQKAAAMGNWWLTALSWQHALSCITSHAEVFGKTSNHPGALGNLVPRDFWLFPKLKSPLKGKRFQIISEIQENMRGSWWQLGELCEIPSCPFWRGLRHHCPLFNVYPVSSSINVSIFHTAWLDTSCTDFICIVCMYTLTLGCFKNTLPYLYGFLILPPSQKGWKPDGGHIFSQHQLTIDWPMRQAHPVCQEFSWATIPFIIASTPTLSG